MIDRSTARSVGAVALCVLAGAIAFVVFLFDRIEWHHYTRVAVYFHQTGGLREGAPFVLAGRTVGSVEAIALSPPGAHSPLNGDEGVVVTVAYRGDVPLGDVFVASQGPLSERYLEIAPKDGMLREGAQLRGADPPSMDGVLNRTWANLQTASKFFAEVKPEFDALRTQVRALVAQLGNFDLPAVAGLALDVSAARDEARALAAKLPAMPSLDVASLRADLGKLSERFAALDAAVQAARGRIDVDRFADGAERAISAARAAIAKVDPLLASVEALQRAVDSGSMMKLMHDPEFPEDAKALGKIMKRHPWRIILHPLP